MSKKKDYGMGGLSRKDRRHMDIMEDIKKEGERMIEEDLEKRKYTYQSPDCNNPTIEEREEQKKYYEDWVQKVKRKEKEEEELKKLRKKHKTPFYKKNENVIKEFKKELNNENFHPNDIKTVDGTLEDRVIQKLLEMDSNIPLKYNYIDSDYRDEYNEIRIVRENCREIFFHDSVPRMENIYLKKWMKKKDQKATWISIIGIKKYGDIYLYKSEIKGDLHVNWYDDTRGIMDYFTPEGCEEGRYLRDINNKNEKKKFFADLKVQKKFKKNKFYKKISVNYNSIWKGNYIFDKPESTITEDRKKFKELEKETSFDYLKEYYSKFGYYNEPTISIYNDHIKAMRKVIEEIQIEVYI